MNWIRWKHPAFSIRKKQKTRNSFLDIIGYYDEKIKVKVSHPTNTTLFLFLLTIISFTFNPLFLFDIYRTILYYALHTHIHIWSTVAICRCFALLVHINSRSPQPPRFSECQQEPIHRNTCRCLCAIILYAKMYVRNLCVNAFIYIYYSILYMYVWFSFCTRILYMKYQYVNEKGIRSKRKPSK